jgi:hypothetical protein
VVTGAGFVLAALLPALLAPAQPAFTLRDAAIGESSGFATSSYNASFILTHNDSGGRPEYFVVDTRTGKTVARVPVGGAKNVDWEDIAVSGHTVYLADIGDNRAARANVTIYSVAETRPGSHGPTPKAIATTLTYDDGPRDAEALLAPPGGAPRFVVTKQLLGARVYTIDGAHLRHTADLGAGLVTGGSWSPDGRRIALLSYEGIFVYDAAAWPKGRAQVLPLPPLRQAESITWAGNDAVLVGGEGVHAPVYRVAVPLPAATTPVPSPTMSASVTASPAASVAPTPGGAVEPSPPPSEAPKGKAGLAKSTSLGAIAVVAGLVLIAVARIRRRKRGGLG